VRYLNLRPFFREYVPAFEYFKHIYYFEFLDMKKQKNATLYKKTWGANTIIGIESSRKDLLDKYFNLFYNHGGVPSCGELEIMSESSTGFFARFQTSESIFVTSLANIYLVNYLDKFYKNNRTTRQVDCERLMPKFMVKAINRYNNIPVDESLIYDKINNNFFEYRQNILDKNKK